MAHAALAEEVGMPKANVFVLGNGDCLELSASGARVTESVEHGVVYVDGLGVGDVGQVVLRDRQLLAKDGIATVVVTSRRSDGSSYVGARPHHARSDPGRGRQRPDRGCSGTHRADSGEDL